MTCRFIHFSFTRTSVRIPRTQKDYVTETHSRWLWTDFIVPVNGSGAVDGIRGGHEFLTEQHLSAPASIVAGCRSETAAIPSSSAFS